MEVPSGAGISIPVWYVAAPRVGALRFPKYELILVYPGIGHIYSLEVSKKINLFEFSVWS